MKSILVLVFSILFLTSGFSQSPTFSIRSAYGKSITKERLNQVETLSDIHDAYPASWITNYGVVKIQTVTAGDTTTMLSRSEVLTEEQKQMLFSAEAGSDISVDVTHYYSNPVTGVLETRNVQFSYSVIPEIEAVFADGEEAMVAYFTRKAIQKIPETLFANGQQAVVEFTINEDGQVNQALMDKSSGHPDTDALLLRTVSHMPKWVPAKNAEGAPVPQKFLLIVGHPGC